MWLLYAFLSAIFAALVAIFGKIGLTKIDPTLATAVRGVIMALFMIGAAFALKKFEGFTFASFSNFEWLMIIFAGVAGAISWLFYFWALSEGSASAVSAIDRLSIVFVIVLAALFLGESFTLQKFFGAGLIVVGAVLVSFRLSELSALATKFFH